LFAFASCAVVTFIPMHVYEFAIVDIHGHTEGKWVIGFMNFSLLVILIHAIVYLGTRNYNLSTIIPHIISPMLYFPFILTFNNFSKNAHLYMDIYATVYKQPHYWLTLFICAGIVLVPYYLVRSVYFLFIYPKFI
jgi:hypothetical protein